MRRERNQMIKACFEEGCTGVLKLVRNDDRSLDDPASRMKYTCSMDDDHVFEDANSMPRDWSRSITE